MNRKNYLFTKVQNKAAHNIRVPKRKVFKMLTSHNGQCHKTYIVTKHFVTVM